VTARELRDSVVVVTGATSGVGRATAHALAERGCRLALVARDHAGLAAVAEECAARGAEAIAVPTDIAFAIQVDRLVTTVVERFGRIDTWIEAAAVLAAGVLGDEPTEELERLVDTNVLGTLLCSRAALRQFREQGHGVLINVSSLLGVLPNPLVPAYVMSKFAVRGLSLSLHHLTRQWPGIRVCVILPGPIDTPMFERAANHTGHVIRAIPPALAPERVAAAIVRCARRPRRQVIVGAAGRAISVAHRVAPAATERLVAIAVASLLLRPEELDGTPGGLFAVTSPAQLHGPWRRVGLRRRAGEAWGRWGSRRA